jgi:hypothetical protein
LQLAQRPNDVGGDVALLQDRRERGQLAAAKGATQNDSASGLCCTQARNKASDGRRVPKSQVHSISGLKF